MNIVAHTLTQDRIWVDRFGEEFLLEEMDPGYLCNLVPFLRGNARTIYALYHEGLVDVGDVEDVAVEEWLVHTPLVRRVLELVRGIQFEVRQSFHKANRDYEELTGYVKVRRG